MPMITFYRQARADGGVRTGIEIDREPVFGRLEEGTEAFDPRLTWYVNVECVGDDLPSRPDEARDWLLSQADVVGNALDAAAEAIGAGLDLDPGPQEREAAGSPPGVRITLVFSAIRRFDSQRLASVLRSIGLNWEALVESLPSLGTPVA